MKKLTVCHLDLDHIKNLKKEEGTDIYLCGGGQFAGWLLNNGLIDILKIKLNPLLLGTGIPLFSEVEKQHDLKLTGNEAFPHGFFIKSYDIVYG